MNAEVQTKKRYCGLYFQSVGRFAIVTGRGRDSVFSAGDLIVSVNGDRLGDVGESLKKLPLPAVIEFVKPWGKVPQLSRVTLTSIELEEGATPIHIAIAELWAVEGLGKLALNSLEFRTPAEDASISQSLLRQRRILSDNMRGILRGLRATRQELTETQDRLAATSTKLGDALTANFVLEVKLQEERETSARLEAVVRRMAARPRAKRTTTHVEIAGLVFRNRTGARA